MSFLMTCLKQTIVREPNPSHFTTHWVLIITYSSNDLVGVYDVQQKKDFQFETFVGYCLGPSRHDSLACHISLTAIMSHIKANITKGCFNALDGDLNFANYFLRLYWEQGPPSHGQQSVLTPRCWHGSAPGTCATCGRSHTRTQCWAPSLVATDRLLSGH